MNKAYKSVNSSKGEMFQKSQTAGHAHNEDKSNGTMEPLERSLTMHGSKNSKMGAKDVMNKMKYAPKTVSYNEFTSAKRNAKMQSMIGATKDESTTKGMEKLNVSTIPSHKATKSFDIDVTSYKPRTAKAMKNK
jgi:hypothetical protein